MQLFGPWLHAFITPTFYESVFGFDVWFWAWILITKTAAHLVVVYWMIEVLEVVPAHPSVIFSFVSSHIWLQTAFGMQQNVVFPHFRLQTYFFLLLSKLKTCNTPFPIASKATEASTPTTVQSTCVPMGTSAQMAREPRRWRAAAVQPSYTGHHETLLEKSRTHKCTSYWPFVTATSWFHGAKVPHLTCTQKLYVQVTTKPIFFFHCSFCCCRKAIVDVLYFGTLFFKASVGRYVFGRFQHRAKKTPFNLQKLTQSWIQQWCDAKSSKYYQYYQKLNHY